MTPALRVVVCVLIAASGCATLPPHVDVPAAPTPASPYADRAAYMKKYYPQSREGDHVFLNGGDRVYYPEDLSPAVDADSPTAKAIADHLAARTETESMAWLATTGSIVTTVGLGVFLSSLVVLFLPIDDETQKTAVIGTLGGGGALMCIGLATLFVNILIVGDDAERALEAADRAARTYPQSLSDRLGVHIDADGNIIDNSVVPPPALPAPEPRGEAEL